MLEIGWESCPFCGRHDLYISRPKHWFEEVAILLLLRPVRCHDCMRRFFRPLFASPPPRMRSPAMHKSLQNEVSATDTKRAA